MPLRPIAGGTVYLIELPPGVYAPLLAAERKDDGTQPRVGALEWWSCQDLGRPIE